MRTIARLARRFADAAFLAFYPDVRCRLEAVWSTADLAAFDEPCD